MRWQRVGRDLATEQCCFELCQWRGAAATDAKSLQSCPTLCDPIDSSPPGSFVNGIFQARILGLSFPPPGYLPHSGIKLTSSALADGFFTTEAPRKPIRPCCYCLITQSCLTLCDPMDPSTPGFPVLHCLLELAQTHVH